MPVIVLRLQECGIAPTGRPMSCPYCGSHILQSWGQAPKQIQDLRQQSTAVCRYRCADCKRTFRHYPSGVDRSVQSLRLRKMAALAWVMGLSSRDVVEVFDELGIDLSRMTVWREGRELARQLEERDEQGVIRKYALDRVYLPGVSARFGVVVVFDAGTGKRAILGTLDEFNPRPVKTWLERLVQDTNFQVTVANTDYLTPLANITGEFSPSIS